MKLNTIQAQVLEAIQPQLLKLDRLFIQMCLTCHPMTEREKISLAEAMTKG